MCIGTLQYTTGQRKTATAYDNTLYNMTKQASRKIK